MAKPYKTIRVPWIYPDPPFIGWAYFTVGTNPENGQYALGCLEPSEERAVLSWLMASHLGVVKTKK